METLSDTSTPAKRPPSPKTIHRWFIAIPFLVAIVWSLIGLNVTLSRLLDAPGDAWSILRQMAPPAFGEVYERGAVGKIFESVYIAWIGTIIGAFVSLPLAFFCLLYTSPSPRD